VGTPPHSSTSIPPRFIPIPRIVPDLKEESFEWKYLLLFLAVLFFSDGGWPEQIWDSSFSALAIHIENFNLI
jgi:hypothetical protein